MEIKARIDGTQLNPDLSEQQIVDCAGGGVGANGFGSYGCNGGWSSEFHGCLHDCLKPVLYLHACPPSPAAVSVQMLLRFSLSPCSPSIPALQTMRTATWPSCRP
jgi:hypothetical protein